MGGTLTGGNSCSRYERESDGDIYGLGLIIILKHTIAFTLFFTIFPITLNNTLGISV